MSDSLNFRIKDSPENTYPTCDNNLLVKYSVKHNPNTLNITTLKFLERYLNPIRDKRTFQLKFTILGNAILRLIGHGIIFPRMSTIFPVLPKIQ